MCKTKAPEAQVKVTTATPKAQGKRSGKKAAPANTVVEPPKIYLSLPADYSGDVWHAAAAMLVNCRVEVIITYQSSELDSKDGQTMVQSTTFFSDCGISVGRVHQYPLDQQAKDAIEGAKKIQNDIARDNASATAHRDCATRKIAGDKRRFPKGGIAHAVYSSTYLWTSALRDDPVNPLKLIFQSFTREFEKKQAKAAAEIRSVVANLTSSRTKQSAGSSETSGEQEIASSGAAAEDATTTTGAESEAGSSESSGAAPVAKKAGGDGAVPFMLLNMRLANYHPQDNTSEPLYRQIEAFCEWNGIRLIRVGSYWEGNKTHRDEGQWMKDLATPVVDIYNFCKLRGGRANMQATAYFWALCAGMNACVGVMGGRSGSSDVAGFAGFGLQRKLLCWTPAVTVDPGYQRQHLMAGRFMSLVNTDASAESMAPTGEHLAKTGKGKIIYKKSLTLWEAMEDSFGITSPEEKLVASKTGGPVTLKTKNRRSYAPRGGQGDDGFDLVERQIDDLVKSPGRIEYCGEMIELKRLSKLPEGAFPSTLELERRFVIGESDGTGNNCLIHTMHQLNENEPGAAAGDVAFLQGRRDEINAACQDVVAGDFLDFYGPEGIRLISQYHDLCFHVYQLHWSGMILKHPPRGDLNGRHVYILHSGGNHFQPLWPK